MLVSQVDQLQNEGVAARMQADKLAGSLENVLASREQALRTAKVGLKASISIRQAVE